MGNTSKISHLHPLGMEVVIFEELVKDIPFAKVLLDRADLKRYGMRRYNIMKVYQVTVRDECECYELLFVLHLR